MLIKGGTHLEKHTHGLNDQDHKTHAAHNSPNGPDARVHHRQGIGGTHPGKHLTRAEADKEEDEYESHKGVTPGSISGEEAGLATNHENAQVAKDVMDHYHLAAAAVGKGKCEGKCSAHGAAHSPEFSKINKSGGKVVQPFKSNSKMSKSERKKVALLMVHHQASIEADHHAVASHSEADEGADDDYHM